VALAVFLAWLSFCLLAGTWLGSLRPTWRRKFLSGYGRNRRVGIAFPEDSPRALTVLLLRQTWFLFLAVFICSVGHILLWTGPRLSQSTPNSIAVALANAAVAGLAIVMLLEFLSPFTFDGGEARVVTAEDYVPAITIRLAQAVGVAGIALPVGAVAIGAGPQHDAGLMWWEGLVLVPLAGSLCIFMGLRAARRIVDVAPPTAPTLYLTDVLRAKALSLMVIAGSVSVALAYNSANAVLKGVALIGPVIPAWANAVGMFCALMVLLSLVTVLTMIGNVGSRMRLRLWPQLEDGQRVELDASAG